jgi:hypothetical protein
MSEPERGGDRPGDRDGEVTRLPRGPLVRLDGPALFRIAMVAIALVAILGLRKPCSDGMAGFVTGFDAPPDAAPAAAPLVLERLSEEDIRRRFPGSNGDAGPVEPTAPGAPSAAAPAGRPVDPPSPDRR